MKFQKIQNELYLKAYSKNDIFNFFFYYYSPLYHDLSPNKAKEYPKQNLFVFFDRAYRPDYSNMFYWNSVALKTI